MIPSLEGSPTKAKEAPCPHEVRLDWPPWDTSPAFQCHANYAFEMLVNWIEKKTFLISKNNFQIQKLFV